MWAWSARKIIILTQTFTHIHLGSPNSCASVLLCALLQYWTDIYLSWNPESYPGVQNLRFPSSLIWMPDILLYNRSVTSHLPVSCVPHSSTTSCWCQVNTQKSIKPKHLETLCRQLVAELQMTDGPDCLLIFRVLCRNTANIRINTKCTVIVMNPELGWNDLKKRRQPKNNPTCPTALQRVIIKSDHFRVGQGCL